ncbi:MAG TPA: histidine kinase [Sphingomicrobium sp.]|nr:histidine kinase [Sphingomicrobium sp.]
MTAALPNSQQPGIFRFNSIACALLCLASVVIHPICRAIMRGSSSLPLLALGTFIVSAAAGSTVALLAELATFGLSGFKSGDWIVAAVQCTLVIFLWCSVYFTVKQWQFAAQERERLLRMEAEVKEAKLSALRYQLNPHFLFNSLNAVSTLCLERKVDDATEMLAKISDLLRILLAGEAAPRIPLERELEFIEAYLAVEKGRLGKRLNVELDCASECMAALVPNMLLQPLVENAIKHGVAPVRGAVSVHIGACVRGDRLHLVVKNSGTVPSAARGHATHPGGIGLANTRGRLKALHHRDHEIVVRWPQEGGCEVIIELPCQTLSAGESARCAS